MDTCTAAFQAVTTVFGSPGTQVISMALSVAALFTTAF
jgi:hypothetical protein